MPGTSRDTHAHNTHAFILYGTYNTLGQTRWLSKMKALVAKPDNLSSILRTHTRWKKKNDSLKLSFDLHKLCVCVRARKYE